MNKYEVIFIVDSRLPDAEKAEISKQVADLIVKLGGKVVSLILWIDRQRMAFQLGKANEGTYYLLNAEMKGDQAAQFRKEMLINERILRFLVIRPEEQKVKKAKKPRVVKVKAPVEASVEA